MNESYVYTIFFLLLGPLKIIPDFLKLTRGTDRAFKRDLAIKASLFSSVIVFFVAFTGRKTILKYQLSLDSLRIAGGVVLLISALKMMFTKGEPLDSPPDRSRTLQLAMSPVSMPMIIPPASLKRLLHDFPEWNGSLPRRLRSSCRLISW